MREAQAPERQLKRSLTALDLTALGIGAIIGTGIFGLTGTAAAGEQVAASVWKTPLLNFLQAWMSHSEIAFGRPGAGPAIVFSFIVAAICRSLLCGIGGDDSGLRIGLYLFLRHAW